MSGLLLVEWKMPVGDKYVDNSSWIGKHTNGVKFDTVKCLFKKIAWLSSPFSVNSYRFHVTIMTTTKNSRRPSPLIDNRGNNFQLV
jgi:hypothetical protein